MNGSTGLIDGTPTATGAFNFTITATDSTGTSDSKTYTVTINSSLSISPAALPSWILNEPSYSQTISASGGTAPVALSLTAGSLPAGLSFTAGTGLLSGTPTATGTFTFTITATDNVEPPSVSHTRSPSVRVSSGPATPDLQLD